MKNMTYVAFVMTCLLLACALAQASEAQPRQVLTAAEARELSTGDSSEWAEWVEGVIREQAKKGNEEVTVKGKGCRPFRSLEEHGYVLTKLPGKRCHISWKDAVKEEERVYDNHYFLSTGQAISLPVEEVEE